MYDILEYSLETLGISDCPYCGGRFQQCSWTFQQRSKNFSTKLLYNKILFARSKIYCLNFFWCLPQSENNVTYTASKSFLSTPLHVIQQDELQLLAIFCRIRSDGILLYVRWILRICTQSEILQGTRIGKTLDRMWRWWHCPNHVEACLVKVRRTKGDHRDNLKNGTTVRKIFGMLVEDRWFLSWTQKHFRKLKSKLCLPESTWTLER